MVEAGKAILMRCRGNRNQSDISIVTQDIFYQVKQLLSGVFVFVLVLPRVVGRVMDPATKAWLPLQAIRSLNFTCPKTNRTASNSTLQYRS